MIMVYTAMDGKLVLEIIKLTLQILHQMHGEVIVYLEIMIIIIIESISSIRDEEAMLGDFIDNYNENDFGGIIVKTKNHKTEEEVE